MPKIWRVYSGSDGQSHIAEEPMVMKPFTDSEGAYGEGTPAQAAKSIAFRVSPPGYVLNWHCAPRRQYSIALAGTAEIEVGDGDARVRRGQRRHRRRLAQNFNGPIRPAVALVSLPRGLAIDLDHVVDDVHDPVFREPGPRVETALLTTVESQA